MRGIEGIIVGNLLAAYEADILKLYAKHPSRKQFFAAVRKLGVRPSVLKQRRGTETWYEFRGRHEERANSTTLVHAWVLFLRVLHRAKQ